MIMGFLQSFTYAEIAGLFPNKSGGASVYGAAAWLRYSKFIAPLSVWCNWFAWTPVLSLGCSIAAAYILNALAPVPLFTEASPEVVAYIAANAGTSAADAVAAVTAAATPAIRNWTLYSHTLGPVTLLAQRHLLHRRGADADRPSRSSIAASSAPPRSRNIIGLLVIVPMLIVGVVPILTGQINWDELFAAGAAGRSLCARARRVEHRRLDAGARRHVHRRLVDLRLRNRGLLHDASSRIPAPTRSRRSSIPACSACCSIILVPFTFQGVLGLNGMLATPIVDGSGVADAMAGMVGGGGFVTSIMVMLMILALLLSIMTAMAGSSRTLYQGSVDGWLPRYLDPRQRAWRADAGDVDRSRLQPGRAGHRLRRRDQLLLHPRRVQLRLHHLQLPQPQCRLDPPHRQRPYRAAVAGADAGCSASARSSPSSMRCSWAPAPRCGTRWRCGPA